MRSNFLGNRPGLRRLLPWALWLAAAAVGIPMAVSQAGIGSAPAIVEARVASLSPMRTDHRLRLAKILVQPGQSVKAGELLAQMDTSEIDADIVIVQAKLAYVEIVAGWQQLRMQDDRARTSHELSAMAERSAVDMARIVAEAEHDRGELTQIDANMVIEQKLVDDQLASADRLKAMKVQRAALVKKVEEYKAAVAGARKSASGSTQRLGQWQKQVKDAQAVVAAERAAQEDARAAAGELQRKEIARLELLRKLYDIRAPFDGRVGDILLHVGELSADPASPVLTLVEEQSQRAIAYVRQDRAQSVRVGDLAKLVSRDLASPPLTGRVVAVAPSVTEMPVRFRRLPNMVELGRNVYIQLDASASLPNLAYDAVFNRSRGGGR
jgi:multidrug resistance efflux pump